MVKTEEKIRMESNQQWSYTRLQTITNIIHNIHECHSKGMETKTTWVHSY
jgi:hypothetical protein